MKTIINSRVLTAQLDAMNNDRLSALSTGSTATVSDVNLACPVSRRLAALGFAPGAEVVAMRVAPFGDPIEFAVAGARVSLRRRDAARIAVIR